MSKTLKLVTEFYVRRQLSTRVREYTKNTPWSFPSTAIPASLSHEDAAAIPLVFATAIGGLYPLQIPPAGATVPLPLPSQPFSVAPILIWGAGSGVGAMAVQIAKLSGYRVIATASRHNFDYVKSIGADFVVDYNDDTVVEEIVKLSEGKLSKVFDAVCKNNSPELGIKSIGLDGGQFSCVNPFLDLKDTKGRKNIQLYVGGGNFHKTKPELHDAFKLLGSLLEKKLIVPLPVVVMPNGLKSVDDGWKRYTDGKIRGQKLVYRIADTPGLREV